MLRLRLSSVRGVTAAAALVALVGVIVGLPRPAAARVYVGFGFGFPYAYPPAYFPPPVYYPPPYYAPPPVVYTPPQTYIPQTYTPMQQGSVTGGQSCNAGSYVCPMDRPVPAGANCYCLGNGGQRVNGRAS